WRSTPRSGPCRPGTECGCGSAPRTSPFSCPWPTWPDWPGDTRTCTTAWRSRRTWTCRCDGPDRIGPDRMAAGPGRVLQAPDEAEGEHGLADPQEPGDVGPDDVVAGSAVLLGGLVAGVVDAGHDPGEPLLGVLEGPAVAAGVLLHLECRGGDAAGVGGLAGPERDARLEERGHGVGGGGHVRPFDHGDDAVADQGGRVGAGELVLGGARKRDVARDVPDAAVGHELRVGVLLRVLADPAPGVELDLLEQLQVQSRLVDHVALGVRAGHHRGAQLTELLDRVQCDVARSGDHSRLAVQAGAADLQQLLGVARGVLAGCLS